MRADLDDLLTDAGRESTTRLDPDEIWAAGRRRRTIRRASTAVAGLAGAVVLGLAVTSFAVGGAAVPEVEPLAPAVEDEAPDGPEEPADEATDDTSPVEPEPAPDPSPNDDATADGDVAEGGLEEAPMEDAPEPPAAPTPATPEPDPGALADPCAPHEAGTAFVDLVAPVDGQVLAGELELVGCAGVFEATVRYRVTDAEGRVVADTFTTATAGAPEIGEFRATVDLEGALGELTVEAFWEDMADGRERDVVTRRVTAE